MRGRIIVFFIVTALSNGVYAGDIFRCTAANGDVMFTNMACPANSQVQHVASYEPVPDSPPAPAYDAAAATSAREARQAAQQARAAAYQAQAVYEAAQTEARIEQSPDGAEYATSWIPFYPRFGSRIHSYHPRPRHTTAHSPQHAMPTPHAQSAAFTLHR